MIIKLTDTTSAEIAARLVDMREEGGVVALGRVLTLLVVAHGPDGVEKAIELTNEASREHPSRVIVVATGDEDGADGLDAEIRIGGDAGASEVIVLHPRGAAREDRDTLVTPLLLPDTPIVAFWVGETPESPRDTRVGRMASRRITDVVTAGDSLEVFARLGEHYRPGDTDLSWARITLWRALLASVLDGLTDQVRSVEVCGGIRRPGPYLLAGWLRERLGVEVRVLEEELENIRYVDVDLGGPHLRVHREPGATMAIVSRDGYRDQHTNLPPRPLCDCLMEDLRRLDADEAYAEALHSAARQLAGQL